MKFYILFFYLAAIVLIIIFQWNEQSNIRRGSGSPLYSNLMDYPAYIRKGFSPDDILKIPEGGEWVQFKSLPFSVVNSGLPDLPKRTYLLPFGKPAEEFTIIIRVEMDNEAMTLLENDSSVTPGIYFSLISENWEIFLNGNLVKSQMHLDESGQIISRRTWRDVRFPLDKNLFVLGTNILALRIVGDPAYGITGLYYTEPYYIDDYSIIEKYHQNFLRYFFCGVLAYTGIYYLLIFLAVRKKEEIFNLYYSISSLMLCVHYVMTEGTVNLFIPNSDVFTRLEYSSIFLALPMLCIFIEQLGRRKVSKTSWALLSFSLFISLTQIFFCAQYGDEVMHLFLITVVLYFSFIFIKIVYYQISKWRKNRTQKISSEKNSDIFISLLIGTLIVYACGIFDALDVLFFKSSFRLFLYSTFVFHVGMALTLSGRFSGMFRQLEQSNVILEKTVYDRTLKLEEQTKIAVEASQAKSQFLATISHEIRTPLNAVIGLSEIELQSEIPEKSRNNIKQIYQSGSSLLGLINDILDISKIEAGGLKLIPAEYETASFINDTVNLNRVRIGSKEISFILEIGGDFPKTLIGDELRVKQILSNILSNAIKYTNKGSVTLAVTWEKHSERKALIHFSVRDTGMGIREDDLKKLFVDYAQLNTKENRDIEGTGLGLVITKKLLDMMGGSITVDSEYQKGSVFNVELLQDLVINADCGIEPIGEKTAQELKEFLYITGSKENAIDRSQMPDVKALVVDDMLVNLQVAKGLLEPYGLFVDTAFSGQEAVDKILSENSYDIIFMDHMMPEMDGIEATTIIRKHDANIPIIALTANAVVGMKEMFLNSGFNDFLSKPVDIHKLNEILDLWIPKMKKKEINSEKPASAVINPPLEIPGINVKQGIAATGGAVAGYYKVLSAFCRDIQERLPLLAEINKKNMQENDMANLAIHTHAVKSALRTIGALEISNKAAQLESAGKSLNYAYVSENLTAFIEDLSEITKNINSALEKENMEKEKSQETGGNMNDNISLMLKNLAEALKTKNASDIDRIMEEINLETLDSQTADALDKISGKILMAEYNEALQIIYKLININ